MVYERFLRMLNHLLLQSTASSSIPEIYKNDFD